MCRVQSLTISVVALLATLFCPDLAASPGQETTFFVSLQGDDDAPGTGQCPFATIPRAQRAVRDAKARQGLTGPVVVNIRGGTYALEEPLVFTPEDSGTADCPVVYRGLGDPPAVISGGKRILGFRTESGATFASRAAW